MYLRTFFLTLFLLLAIPATLNVVMDPYQIWHNRWLGAEVYSTNQRYQNAGIIRRFLECADCGNSTILIGTSLTENTLLSDLQQLSDSDNSVRLITHGSYPVEHAQILNRALASGNVQTVYWEIYRNYVGDDYATYPNKNSFPQYLYTQTITDDFRYVLNHQVFKDSLLLLTGQYHLSGKWSEDLNTLNNWHSKALDNGMYKQWSRTEWLDELKHRYADDKSHWDNFKPDTSIESPVVEAFILPIIKDYPDVQFTFFIPPISLIEHRADLGSTMQLELALRKRLSKLSKKHTNVSLYIFDDYEPIVANMAYYKDARHYTQAINKWVIARLTEQNTRFLITAEEFDAYAERLLEMVKNYTPFSSCTNQPDACGVFVAPND
jgi:hypothetical protein